MNREKVFEALQQYTDHCQKIVNSGLDGDVQNQKYVSQAIDDMKKLRDPFIRKSSEYVCWTRAIRYGLSSDTNYIEWMCEKYLDKTITKILKFVLYFLYIVWGVIIMLQILRGF